MSESRPSAELARAVRDRAWECCEYCRSQASFAPDPFSVEHIVPRSRGGATEAANLALSCQGCNNRKYTAMEAIDPVTGDPVPLFHPRRHSWSEHFAWNEDYTLILGLTPTGRATVEKMKLNRSGLVNLRRILADAGAHPPVLPQV
jgi:hypothetical protein